MGSGIRSKACVLAAALGLCAICGTAVAQRPAEGDAARGKQLFYAHGCYACHGYNGETGARDLVGTGSPIVENVDVFLAFLRARAGLAPLFPSTQMPSYSQNALDDAAARDIFAYIRTFELDAPSIDDDPTLRAILESAEASR